MFELTYSSNRFLLQIQKTLIAFMQMSWWFFCNILFFAIVVALVMCLDISHRAECIISVSSSLAWLLFRKKIDSVVLNDRWLPIRKTGFAEKKANGVKRYLLKSLQLFSDYYCWTACFLVLYWVSFLLLCNFFPYPIQLLLWYLGIFCTMTISWPLFIF